MEEKQKGEIERGRRFIYTSIYTPSQSEQLSLFVFVGA